MRRVGPALRALSLEGWRSRAAASLRALPLGVRLLFAFFLINGIAAFFVLRVFSAEIRPSAREVMEDMLVDTAHILAELASDDLAAGTLATGRFAAHVRAYATRPVDAQIWGVAKQSLDFRVTVTDATGRVLFDSGGGKAVGEDHSRWRDVHRTLRGEYGARATRDVAGDASTGVMYVSAPVRVQGAVAGVLTVAKPTRSVQRFVERAERKVLANGVWLLVLSAAVGVAVTLWVVWHIRRLRRYAQQARAGVASPVPAAPGELGELAQAMEAMRLRLEGRDYVEGYVRALTHELKSPVAAIRGAGELLAEPALPDADRIAFAEQVVQQSERLQRIAERLLALSQLEQRPRLDDAPPVRLADCARAAVAAAEARARQRGIGLELVIGQADAQVWGDAGLIETALGNLVDNAIDFAPAGSTVSVAVADTAITVQDAGPGVPDYALARLGERFFTTPRPDGSRSGSGLGLAIARQAMALHGGTLAIANTAPGLRATLQF